MIRQPLFGQDSSPHKTSAFLSLVITVLLWIAMTVVAVVVKPVEKKPKYKEVQIVLSSNTLDREKEKAPEAKSESAPAAMETVAQEITETIAEPVVNEIVEVPVEIPVEAPVPVKPAETPAPKVESKPVPAKTEPKAESPKKVETPAKPKEAAAPAVTPESKKVPDSFYSTSVEDAWEQQLNAKKQTVWDDSMFADDTPNAPVVSEKVTKVASSNEPVMSGSAGSVSNQDQKQTSQSNSAPKTQNASSSTTSSLAAIANTQYSTRTGDSLKAITNAKTSKSSDGQITMEMSDGSKRVLLEPLTPVIKLSDEAAAAIERTVTVTIRFRVIPSGHVPGSEISISPESVLPSIVRNEIVDQLSDWLFDSADTTATASFEYTIEKK